jgi:phosphoribosylformylglycinamidine cyclo-ligase
MPMTYADAGVDIAEGARAVEAIKAAVRETYTPDVIGDIGGFGGLVSAAALKDMDDPVLVSGTDGVGTKLELARRLGRHDTIGIDLVAMCVNDIVTAGARPMFFLDYLAVGKLDAAFAAEVVSGIAAGCKQAGCALIGGEMAEHPGVMAQDAYDLSGFAVGVVDRPKMLGPQRVCRGDVLIGLGSSGLHSNGYSLVRRALTDAMSDEELRQRVVDEKNDPRSYADALLAPTRIYVPEILGLLEAGLGLHAAAHITGGGITENLNRVLPSGMDALVSLDAWELPPIIRVVAEAASLDDAELLRTFNAGLGMILAVSPKDADAACAKLGADAVVIGETAAAPDATAPGSVAYR